MARTGLSSLTQSSRLSGSKVHWLRSAPLMKRFIKPPLQIARGIIADSAFSRSQGREPTFRKFELKAVNPSIADSRAYPNSACARKRSDALLAGLREVRAEFGVILVAFEQ